MKDVEQQLSGTALPYWEAEATIVRAILKGRPEEHIYCLKAHSEGIYTTAGGQFVLTEINLGAATGMFDGTVMLT